MFYGLTFHWKPGERGSQGTEFLHRRYHTYWTSFSTEVNAYDTGTILKSNPLKSFKGINEQCDMEETFEVNIFPN